MNNYKCIGLGLMYCLLVGCSVNPPPISTYLADVFEKEPGYIDVAMPTTNFGLMTIYQGSVASDQTFYCDPWNCLGVRDEEVPRGKNRLSLNGMAAIGKGAPFSLSTSQKQDYALSVLLPQVHQILNLSGEFNRERVVKVVLEADRVYKRLLRRPEFFEFITEGSANAELKGLFSSGELIVIVGDVVIDGLRAKVSFDTQYQAEVEAALAVQTGQLGANTKLPFSVNRSNTGDYELGIDAPVVVRTLPKRQGDGGLLNSDGGIWSGWVDATLRQ